jgi:hypothetical protein
MEVSSRARKAAIVISQQRERRREIEFALSVLLLHVV